MGWITNIAEGINNVFKNARPSLKTIPPLLLLCGGMNRPGLSAIALTSSIIQRLPEAGIETGVNPDGSPNKILKFVRIIVEEIVKELKTNMKVSIAVRPGGVTSVGVGGNAAGEVTVTSQNVNIISGYGIIE